MPGLRTPLCAEKRYGAEEKPFSYPKFSSSCAPNHGAWMVGTQRAGGAWRRPFCEMPGHSPKPISETFVRLRIVCIFSSLRAGEWKSQILE